MESKNITILIADDEPDVLEFVQYNLQKEGFIVLTAPNGQKAIDMAKKYLPQLIILDIMMPEGDGMELLTRMLDHRMAIPVIINSAYSHYKNDFMSWAAEAYVVKSSDLSELKMEIHRVLDKSQMAMV